MHRFGSPTRNIWKYKHLSRWKMKWSSKGMRLQITNFLLYFKPNQIIISLIFKIMKYCKEAAAKFGCTSWLVPETALWPLSQLARVLWLISFYRSGIYNKILLISIIFFFYNFSLFLNDSVLNSNQFPRRCTALCIVLCRNVVLQVFLLFALDSFCSQTRFFLFLFEGFILPHKRWSFCQSPGLPCVHCSFETYPQSFKVI